MFNKQILHQSQKKWLILSHAFNMDGRAASQTMTDKIPSLLAAGIDIYVLSAITGVKDNKIKHKQLIAWGPTSLRFDFRHWYSNRYTKGFFYKLFTALLTGILLPFSLIEKWVFGYSSQWSWALSAFIFGRKLINQGRVNVIYSAASAWSAHLAGYWLKKTTGLPWLAEIHDPMVMRIVDDDDGVIMLKSRDRDERLRYWLEKKICKHADLVWWFTDGALHYAKLRNPNLDSLNNAKSMMLIPGAKAPTVKQVIHKYNNTLTLSHFGSLAEDRSLIKLFEVMPALIQKYPELKRVLRINVYGSELDNLSMETIKKLNLESNVLIYGRVENNSKKGISGREQIVIKMMESDILILLTGETPSCAEYIPSKFYEYLYTTRPIFAITHINPQLDNMLDSRGHYIAHSSDSSSIQLQLEKIWVDWKNKRLVQPKYDPYKVEDCVDKILSAAYETSP